VLIYRSRAVGSYRADADIDLTIIGKNISLSLLSEIENDLDDLLLPYIIDLSVYNGIKNVKLLDHIKRVGKVFYKK